MQVIPLSTQLSQASELARIRRMSMDKAYQAYQENPTASNYLYLEHAMSGYQLAVNARNEIREQIRSMTGA